MSNASVWRSMEIILGSGRLPFGMSDLSINHSRYPIHMCLPTCAHIPGHRPGNGWSVATFLRFDRSDWQQQQQRSGAVIKNFNLFMLLFFAKFYFHSCYCRKYNITVSFMPLLLHIFAPPNGRRMHYSRIFSCMCACGTLTSVPTDSPSVSTFDAKSQCARCTHFSSFRWVVK